MSHYLLQIMTVLCLRPNNKVYLVLRHFGTWLRPKQISCCKQLFDIQFPVVNATQAKVLKAPETHRGLRFISRDTKTKNSMEVQKLSDRLVLHKAVSRDAWKLPGDPSKVLVLFFTWMGAKEKHVNKYRELYTTLGLDVLTIKSSSKDFLWPPTSFVLAKEITSTLKNELGAYNQFLLHSISVGSYNLTVLCMHARQQHLEEQLLKKFSGIIFDSIVVGGGLGGIIKHPQDQKVKDIEALDRMINAVAISVSQTKFVQGILTSIARVYFAATKSHTVDFYETANNAVRDEPVNVPTLVLTCRNDPLTDLDVTEKLVDIWKANHNMPVTLHVWDDSAHAQHYVLHRDEYVNIHKNFLAQVFCVDTGSSGSSPTSVIKSKL
ncbi:unnamed protein product [Lymnaea stagnalis]|uniref:Transmembrane protein 53 n=1 Tax=Lymnaea stagnalis TaxID=6523 RepID=A0AAV2I1T9_LYMST